MRSSALVVRGCRCPRVPTPLGPARTRGPRGTRGTPLGTHRPSGHRLPVNTALHFRAGRSGEPRRNSVGPAVCLHACHFGCCPSVPVRLRVRWPSALTLRHSDSARPAQCLGSATPPRTPGPSRSPWESTVTTLHQNGGDQQQQARRLIVPVCSDMHARTISRVFWFFFSSCYFFLPFLRPAGGSAAQADPRYGLPSSTGVACDTRGVPRAQTRARTHAHAHARAPRRVGPSSCATPSSSWS